MNLEGPVLLGFTPELITPVEQKQTNRVPWTALPRHRDEDQVQLDVDRAFVYYPKGSRSAFPQTWYHGLNASR